MSRQIPDFERLDDEQVASLAHVVVGSCWMPNPDVVAQFDDAVFPTIRDQKLRISLDTTRAPPIMLDDNTTPRWAFVWSHGISDVAHRSGWTFAHVWPESKCPASYTNLANLVLMPEYFASLTDKQGPLCAYFRFHAWKTYGWRPPSRDVPERPVAFEQLAWRYMANAPAAVAFVRLRLDALNNQRANLLRQLMTP